MVTVFSTHVIVGSLFNDIRIKKKFSTKAGIPDFFSIISWDLRYLNNALATIVSKVITAPKMDIHAASAAAGEFKNSALNILELIGFITLIHPPVGFLSFSLFVPSTTQFARHNKTASGCHYSAMNVPFAKIMRLLSNMIRTGTLTEADRDNWVCRVKKGWSWNQMGAVQSVH